MGTCSSPTSLGPRGRRAPRSVLSPALRHLLRLPIVFTILAQLCPPAPAAPLVAGDASSSPILHTAHLAPSRAAITLLSTATAPDGTRRTLAFDRDLPCELVPVLDVYAPDAFPRNPRTDPDFPGAASSDEDVQPRPLPYQLTFEVPADHPLAPGRFLLLAGDADRAPLPLGDLLLDASLSPGDTAVLRLDPAPGLFATRLRTDFLPAPLPSAETPEAIATESFHFDFHNATSRRTTIHVIETFPRSSDFALTSATRESRPGPRPGTLLFPVLLPPRGNASLDYTVQYTFAP